MKRVQGAVEIFLVEGTSADAKRRVRVMRTYPPDRGVVRVKACAGALDFQGLAQQVLFGAG